jgi:hypothetical protein
MIALFNIAKVKVREPRNYSCAPQRIFKELDLRSEDNELGLFLTTITNFNTANSMVWGCLLTLTSG